MSTKILFFLAIYSFLAVFLIFLNRKRIIQKAKRLLIDRNLKKSLKNDQEDVLSVNKTSAKSSEKYDLGEIKKGLKRAEILIEHNEEKEAQKILVSILAVAPNNVEAQIFLASLYLKKQQYSAAESVYRSIAEIQNYKDTAILSNLAFCLFEQNKIEESIYFYEEALAKDKKNIKRYTNLAQVLFITKDFDKSIDLFKKALKFNPRDTVVLFMLADTYRESEKFELAKNVYKKILEYEPYNVAAKEEVFKLENMVI